MFAGIPKTLHKNLIPTTSLTASQNVVSKTVTDLYARGVRVFLNVAAATSSGSNDTILLCAVSPSGNIVPMVANSQTALMLTVGAGNTGIFDFYPSTLPISITGLYFGQSAVFLPRTFAIKVQLGSGATATFTVDVETLP